MPKIKIIELFGERFARFNNEAIERGGNEEVIRVGKIFKCIEKLINEGRMRFKKHENGAVTLDGQEGGTFANMVVDEYNKMVAWKKGG